MDEGKETLILLIIGIWIFDVMNAIAGMLIVHSPFSYLAGSLIGGGVATGLAMQMYHSLDRQLDMDKKHATANARLHIIIRGIVTVLVLVVSMLLYRYIHPVGVFLGLFGLKISVYMQFGLRPFARWIQRKRVNK